MESKESPEIGIREEVKRPFKEEALNARNLGGETVPAWPADEEVDPTPGERPSTGKLSKYPYEVVRKGVVRK